MTFDDMSVPQKLQMIEALWESIAATPEPLPVPEWQFAELDRRKAEYLAHPESGLSWEEAVEMIRGGHGR